MAGRLLVLLDNLDLAIAALDDHGGVEVVRGSDLGVERLDGVVVRERREAGVARRTASLLPLISSLRPDGASVYADEIATRRRGTAAVLAVDAARSVRGVNATQLASDLQGCTTPMYA
jgi:hypothetical protein